MRPVPGEHPLHHLVGQCTPGGSYELASYENWLLRDAVYAEQDAVAHPIAAFIGAQRGIGCTVAELFAMLQCDIDDGPVLAESTIELNQDFAVDRRYRVAGEVTAIDRKHGAKFGTFDLVSCRFTLVDEPEREPVAVVTNVYAIARPGQP